jgi:flagellar biosynthesis protein FlhB
MMSACIVALGCFIVWFFFLVVVEHWKNILEEQCSNEKEE